MPAIPWLLGALGIGAGAGVLATDKLASLLRWAAIGGAVYLIYTKAK